MEWTEKTNYYIQLPQVKLMEILDKILVSIVGYDPDIVWTLGDVCRGIKYLENDEVAINIQVSNPMWTKEQGVLSWIDKQDFDLAKYYFQVDEFLSQEEYDALIQIEIINN